jgi:uncharacterized protein YndB with AHSA1/START domain
MGIIGSIHRGMQGKPMSTDRIEKKVLLRVPLERVWRAISDAAEFGAWFGVKFDGPFAEGADLTGTVTPTTADAAVAKLQEPYAGAAFRLAVERIEPMRQCCFRWHPFAIDPGVDYSAEAMTLIVFELEPRSDGVQLTIGESGFERLPPARRASAYAANDGGWAHQIRLIEKYLALRP